MTKNTSIASKRGFTLIEIVIVLSIITIMAATILPREIKRIQIKAGEKTALEMSVVQEAARAYYVAVKSWPGNIVALQSGGYLNSSWITNNPWGNAYNASSTASTYTVSTTVPAEWVNLVARDLPSATISGNTVSSTIAIPGTSYDERVKASSSDSISDYLDQKVAKSITVSSNKLELRGDVDAPGNDKVYGTTIAGIKGWRDTVDEKVKASSSDSSAGYLDGKVDNVTIEVASNTLRVRDASISQFKLKTATGEVSASSFPTFVGLILPGGEYGFFPQIKQSGTSPNGVYFVLGWDNQLPKTPQTYTTMLSVYTNTGATLYAKQRYVTASGEDMWIFLLIDKDTKEIISAYQAPDHPAYGNGGDFDKMPHPFPSYDDSKQEIILLDKETCNQLKQESKQTGKSILTLISEEYKPGITDEVYQPLHSGKFMDENGKHIKQMVQNIPSYIKVRKLERDKHK